jgi:hypothetical protein
VPHGETHYLVDGPDGYEIDPEQIARSPLCSVCAGSGRRSVRILTDAEREQIRLDYVRGGRGSQKRAWAGHAKVTIQQLAARYDVTETTIRKIVRGR